MQLGLRFLFNTLVLMKYPDGSAVRGFSLGATAGLPLREQTAMDMLRAGRWVAFAFQGTLAGNMWCTKIVVGLHYGSFRIIRGRMWSNEI